MRLFDVLKPKWKHSDPDVRKMAIRSRTVTDEALLARVAQTDTSEDVRSEAVGRLSDQKLLVNIAKSDKSELVRGEAVLKLDDQGVVEEIVKNDISEWVRQKAIGKISSQSLIAHVAQNDNSDEVRSVAAAKVQDQNVLAAIARTDAATAVREAAIERLQEDSLLADIAKTDESKYLRWVASLRITDKSVVAEINAAVPDLVPGSETCQRCAESERWYQKALFKAVRAREDLPGSSFSGEGSLLDPGRCPYDFGGYCRKCSTGFCRSHIKREFVNALDQRVRQCPCCGELLWVTPSA